MVERHEPIKMAQYGTKHAHAEGVLTVTLANPDVEFVGVYEGDSVRRAELKALQRPPWSQVRWIDDLDEMLGDPTIVAILSEGKNEESLGQTEEIVDAGKHVFYDKPAGDGYPQFERIVSKACEKGLLIQLGYMFRYHDGFQRIAEFVHSGFLGRVFSVRARMATLKPDEGVRTRIGVHRGGILYDLAGHMLDQIVWLLGRPDKVTSYLRHDDEPVSNFSDNTLGVFEFENAMAMVDISAIETLPGARRFEVYGSEGWVVMEPFEPAQTLRMCLPEARGGYGGGITIIPLEDRPRYVASLSAFIQDVRGEKKPDRTLGHELLVQETLLRATGGI